MALGHLRIDPNQWVRWTLRQFDIAYKSWREINVVEPWRRSRAISYYTIIGHGTKVENWEDLFSIEGDKIKPKNVVLVREQTKEEKEEYKNIVNGR